MGEPDLSVVIPALDAAETLPAALAALEPTREAGLLREVLVVDGGSADGTTQIAADWGARVREAPRGRGAQLAAGADAAVGRWLLFLHADTRLAPGWDAAARGFMAAPGSARRAAAFRLALDDADPRARRIARLANWRARRFGLPYGDQGLLIARSFYRELGGYRPLPLMEDVDLVRRIGRRRLAILEAEAVTSALRYRRDGWWLRPLRNLALLGLYFLGAPPRLLRRLYG
jgi:rSAM/selenodomain-associated transferase 2